MQINISIIVGEIYTTGLCAALTLFSYIMQLFNSNYSLQIINVIFVCHCVPNVQKLNKHALKLNVSYFLALSMSMVALFAYCYFNIELVCVIGVGLELISCN